MKQNNSKQAYENYMAAAYSPENIAKAGGKEAHAAIMKKFKRHERWLSIKSALWMFFHCYLPMIIVLTIVLLVIKNIFF